MTALSLRSGCRFATSPAGTPFCQPIYRAGAPAIDFYAPDIYWPYFEGWVARYQEHGNPVFVPESRLELAPYDALYAFGQARAIGFSAFGVDGGAASTRLGNVYRIVSELGSQLLAAQARGETRALILHLTSPRPEQTVALGGFLFRATLARSWRTHQPLTADGAMLVMQSAPGEFYVLGSGLSISFRRDPDVDDRIAGIATIAQLAWKDGAWSVAQRLNGDQSDQGRQLLLDPREVALYRVRLYTYSRH